MSLLRERALLLSKLMFCSCFIHQVYGGEITPDRLQRRSLISPREQSCGEKEEETLLLPSLKGILLYRQDQGNDRTFVLGGVTLRNIHLPPASAKNLAESLNREFIDKPLYQHQLNELRQQLLYAFAEAGRPFVVVQFPDQDIDKGVLEVHLMESEISDVRVKGNRYIEEGRYKEFLAIDSGQPIQLDQIIDRLDWTNRVYAFQRAWLQFSPGPYPYSTDVDILVEDHHPYKFYAGVDNTGLDVTGKARLFAGFNLSDLFKKGYFLSYQYMTSSHLRDVNIHALRAEIPFSCRHHLHLFGGYSFVRTEVGGSSSQSLSGKNWQFSTRYKVPLASRNHWKEVIGTGFDFKRSKNEIEFNSLRSSSHYVNMLQLILDYTTEFRVCNQAFEGGLELFLSPGDLIGDQTSALYDLLRPEAKSTYVYGKGSLAHILPLPKEWGLWSKLRFQFASTNLLPSEQQGLGGSNTVRGYKERSVNVDNSLIFNSELLTPKFSFFSKNATAKKEECWGLLFLDVATGWQDHKFGTEKKGYTLLSVGPGVRYTYGENIQIRLDWGARLLKLVDNGQTGRFHFSILGSF